ncbi:hypothetical protein [Aquidulcibacter sp.]|jgi:hypothetical protein|uniref:hypothetical protein n=1 Tax=Aquidulcibacter sp. TaxID=2052990 RepID=UPI0037BE541E
MAGEFDHIVGLLVEATGYYPGKSLDPKTRPLSDLIQSLESHPHLCQRWTQTFWYPGGWRELDATAMATYLVFDLIRGTSKIEEVAAAFSYFAASTEFEIRSITAISGPTFEQVVELSDRVRLVPPSSLSTGFGKERFFNADGFQYQWVMPTAAIEIGSAAKIVDCVNRSLEAQGYLEFQHTHRQVEEIRQILILHSNCPVEILGTYSEIVGAKPLFNHFFGASYRDRSLRAPSELSQIGEMLQSAYKHRKTTEPTIQLATNKLSSSRSRKDDAEAFFDLGSALEILLTKGDSTKSEINYRLALRAALLLGSTQEDRRRWSKLTKDIYSQRSTAAHQGALKPPKTETEAAKRASLRLQAEDMIVRLIGILSERFPDWTELELGMSSASTIKADNEH